MQVLPEYGHAYAINDVNTFIHPEYAWFYDLAANDFMLKPIHMLEETVGPTVVARINKQVVKIPASWHMMIVDEDTKTVDTVMISSASGFYAYGMHPSLNRYEPLDVQLLDLELKGTVVHLSIPRMTMICHPVGNTVISKDLPMNVLIGPQDLGKHMVSVSAQEMLI